MKHHKKANTKRKCPNIPKPERILEKATEKVYSYDMKGKDIKANRQQTKNKQTKIIQRILCKLEEHHFLFHFLKNK